MFIITLCIYKTDFILVMLDISFLKTVSRSYKDIIHDINNL